MLQLQFYNVDTKPGGSARAVLHSGLRALYFARAARFSWLAALARLPTVISQSMPWGLLLAGVLLSLRKTGGQVAPVEHQR